MSIPYDTYTCSDCDYIQTNAVTWGTFRYAGLREAHMNRTIGICYDCEEVSAVERLSSGPFDPPSQRSRLEWLLAMLGRPTRAMRLKDELAMIETIDRPPVCLGCGSPRCQPLPRPNEYREDGRLYDLDHHHPGCGGRLLVHHSREDRMAVSLSERHYDLATGAQVAGPPVLRFGEGLLAMSPYNRLT